MYESKQPNQQVNVLSIELHPNMDTAELDAIGKLNPTAETSDSSAIDDLEEPSFESLEASAEDLSLSSTDELEFDERDGDELAAARPTGYRKTQSDDAVGAFLKKWRVIPCSKQMKKLN